VNARGSRLAGSECAGSRSGRAARGVFVLLVALLGPACQRNPAPPEPAPAPTTQPKAVAPAPSGAVVPAGGAGAAAVAELPLTEPLTGDGLYLCTNKYEDQVVQRVALPTGQAFLVSHRGSSWLTSEGERLEDVDLQRLERAFRSRHFLDFPEHVDTGKPNEREWDLRFASKERGHRAVSYEDPAPAFHEIFAACDEVFTKLPSTPSDATVALAIYRALEEYGQSLKRSDPRRQMLLEWLDSLQADFSAP
jgi:hypothetical protein